MKRFAGILTPIVTPFASDPSGVLDEAAMRANVARWAATSLSGLVVLGSNGEAAQLDDAEADRAIAVVRDVLPREKWLLAGTGRESTAATIAATARAAALGVDAVLVRTPSFFKSQMTSEVFVRHYTAVADASPVPVLLYNVSMFTGVNLGADAVERLATHPNIVGMKESGSDIGLIAEFVARTPDDFTVLAGSATTFVHALAAGCDGAILALGAILPDECRLLVELVAAGRLKDARAVQRRVMPLARSVGTTYGVAGLKAALDLLGYTGGAPRPPLLPATPEAVEVIRRQLTALGILDGGSQGDPPYVRQGQ
ncbi:MAG: dihydrodipicolinate synthase family protein [Vicinamibacterales bacterium]